MVNPVTFLIFIIVIYQSLHANDLRRLSFLLFVDSLVFALLTNSGYFIKIGSLSIEYEEALMVCFITVLTISGGIWRLRSSIFVKSLVLLATVSVGLCLLAVNPINILVLPIGGSWDAYYAGSYILEPLTFSVRNSERLFRLVLFIIVVIGLNDLTRDKKFRLELIKAIIVITVLQTALGYLDLGTKLFFHQPVLQSLATSLLGQGASQYQSIGKRAGAYFIQALMKEPSHFAVSLVPGLTIFALSRKRNVSTSLLEIASVAILFLSGSFAGFAIILYWLTLKLFRYVLESKLGKIISFAIVIGVLILIVFLIGMLADIIPLLGYYLSRLSGLIGTGPSIGSESIRLYSIKSSLEYLSKRPVFGIGLGSTSAHGFIPSLLSNIGLAGFIIWIVFLLDAFSIRRRNFVPLILWLILAIFTGDIGWFYNIMGLTMLLAVANSSCYGNKQKSYANSLERREKSGPLKIQW